MIVASVLAIFALGVGAVVYHTIERLILARRISTVRTAAKPLQPLLPVMAAIMGLTQGVVGSLGDVTDLPGRRWELPQLPMLKWMENPLGNRGNRQIIDSDDELSGQRPVKFPDRNDRALCGQVAGPADVRAAALEVLAADAPGRRPSSRSP